MVTFRGHSRFHARGASGKYQLDVRQIRDAFVATETDRDIVVVPELWLDNPPSSDAEVARLLRGTLDVVWQSAGWERSPYFTPEGDWKPPR
jgi:hypothetical protein